MPAKYLINDEILDQLDEAMVRANILHEDQALPLDPIQYHQQTYALRRALRDAIGKIRRYDRCDPGAMSK